MITDTQGVGQDNMHHKAPHDYYTIYSWLPFDDDILYTIDCIRSFYNISRKPVTTYATIGTNLFLHNGTVFLNKSNLILKYAWSIQNLNIYWALPYSLVIFCTVTSGLTWSIFILVVHTALFYLLTTSTKAKDALHDIKYLLNIYIYTYYFRWVVLVLRWPTTSTRTQWWWGWEYYLAQGHWTELHQPLNALAEWYKLVFVYCMPPAMSKHCIFDGEFRKCFDE